MSEKLTKEGWIKTTTIDEPRLSEIVSEYISLGFEVHLEPIDLGSLGEQCKSCYRNHIDKIRTVYIRKRKK
jgi:hypothetical protein